MNGFVPALTVADVGADKTVIVVHATKNRPPEPEELAFYSRANQMHSKIKRLLKGNQALIEQYTSGIRGAMKVALQDPGNLASGGASLDAIRDGFIEDEGPGIRRKFLLDTLLHAVLLFGGAIALASLLLAFKDALEFMASARDILFDAAWVAAGAAVGIAFFAFVNSLTITFDNVGRFDSTGLGPSLRLVFVAIVLIALAVLLLTNAVTIGIGTATLNKFRESSQIAFLLGLFGAYSDIQATRLISNVLDRAAERRAAS